MKKMLVAIAFALLLQQTTSACAQGLDWSVGQYEKFDSMFTGDAVRNQDESPLPLYVEDRTPKYYLVRYVLEGPHDSDDWVEAMETINTVRSDEPRSVKKWYKQFHTHAESSCPSEWNVIEQQRKSMLFERQSGACNGLSAQHALYRVLYGNYDVFVMIATRKPVMNKKTRDAWLRLLRSARLTTDSPPEDAQTMKGTVDRQ